MIGVDRPREVADRLRRRLVPVDWRPGVRLRFGALFFNTDDEVRGAIDILAELTA